MVPAANPSDVGANNPSETWRDCSQSHAAWKCDGIPGSDALRKSRRLFENHQRGQGRQRKGRRAARRNRSTRDAGGPHQSEGGSRGGAA